jgi:hydrogenase maturation protease
MNFDLVEKIADAVLYEGYILYPYRPSAVKNQQRWNFGALCPPSYSEAQSGTEACVMQTECLLDGREETTLSIKLRFLHLVKREVAEAVFDCRSEVRECEHRSFPALSPAHFRVVPSLTVLGKTWQTWEEAVEREVLLSDLKLSELAATTFSKTFSFRESELVEPLREESSGEIVALVLRRQQAINGAIEVRVTPLETDSVSTLKLTVRVLNRTPLADAAKRSRSEALMRSLVSTHTILQVNAGGFYSQLDPPETLRSESAGCSNIGTYPVLVGDEGARECMLSSPIILYDYPQIAPESAGNLFDGTEIDEILTLRIMTLTEDEKNEIRGADDRARLILERTETLPAEQLMKMHGAMRGARRK